VHPNTRITDLTIYVFFYDSKFLAVTSTYFVDYALTSVFYGTQTAFITLSQGYIDNDYIGGISSFSMVNNYEFNGTLNSLLVTASVTSLYNSFPQLQIRLRLCQAPYTYYNLADGLCYAVCPPSTYAYSIGLICYPCLSNCVSCLNSTVCTTCAAGMVLAANSTCVCANYSFYYNGACHGCHHSCATCTYSGQYYNCLTCDSAMHRSLAPFSGFNNTCDCDSTFTDVGVPLCVDKCGDGHAIISQCDDNNIISGDGCSSTCQK